MLAITTVSQKRQDQCSRKIGSTKSSGNLEIGQGFHPCRRRCDETAPHGSRQGFRKTADLDDPVQTIESSQPWCRLRFKIRKNIILDDGEARLFGQHQQAMGGNGGKPCACRIMNRGIGNIKTWLMLFQCLLEKRQVRSSRRIRHTNDFHPMRPQESAEVEIAGIIDNHRIPRLQQETTQEIDRLRAGIGEHDLADARLYAMFGKSAGQKLA